MAVLSWQAGSASGSFLTGTIIQGLIYVNNSDYAGTAWQGTLLVFAMVTFIFVCNIWGARGLPMIQNLLLVVHVFGFLVVVIVLWTLAPRNSPTKVFSEFYNGGHWSSVGLALMIGQISAIYGSLCKLLIIITIFFFFLIFFTVRNLHVSVPSPLPHPLPTFFSPPLYI